MPCDADHAVGKTESTCDAPPLRKDVQSAITSEPKAKHPKATARELRHEMHLDIVNTFSRSICTLMIPGSPETRSLAIRSFSGQQSYAFVMQKQFNRIFVDLYTFPRLAYCSCELFWLPVENYLNLIQPDTLPSKLTSVLSPRGCCIGKSVPGLVSKPIELIIALVPTD